MQWRGLTAPAWHAFVQVIYVPCPLECYFVVGEGDTLDAIATASDTTVEAILAGNPGLDPYNLPLGQVRLLQPPCPPRPPCVCMLLCCAAWLAGWPVPL